MGAIAYETYIELGRHRETSVDRKLTRRQLTKLIGAGAGAAALGRLPALGVEPETALAHTGSGIRRHGVVLTNASMSTLSSCILNGGYDILKMVTGWGMGPSGGWTTSNIQTACSKTAVTIVRTNRGDGANRPEGPDWGYPIANDDHLGPGIITEIQPWYAAKSNIAIELGNEPNGNTGWVAAG